MKSRTTQSIWDTEWRKNVKNIHKNIAFFKVRDHFLQGGISQYKI